MPVASLKPKQLTKSILSDLQSRACDIILSRYGLRDDAERKTLEAIGRKYGVTRERVRQIENMTLEAIKKSNSFKSVQPALEELRSIIESLGAIVHEENLLSHFSKDKCIQNHIHFHLVLGDDFKKHKEDDHFHSRWSVNDEVADGVHAALEKLYAGLDDDEIVAEGEIISRFLNYLKDLSDHYRNEEIARRWLSISKALSRNPLGDWGKITSPNIRMRGVKDYAYLIMKKHGSPLHFTEVANGICDSFDREINSATCHNELIKDPRFILVGRGLYALSEWGYKPGVVSEVIRDILKKEGSLSREEIIKQVLKERYLKRNTILVNLQNQKKFRKTRDGRYTLA